MNNDLDIKDLVDCDVKAESGLKINTLNTLIEEDFLKNVIEYDYNLDTFDENYVKSIYDLYKDDIYDLVINYNSIKNIWKVGYSNTFKYILKTENSSLSEAINNLKEITDKYMEDNKIKMVT